MGRTDQGHAKETCRKPIRLREMVENRAKSVAAQ
jgi:hypothetical protein